MTFKEFIAIQKFNIIQQKPMFIWSVFNDHFVDGFYVGDIIRSDSIKLISLDINFKTSSAYVIENRLILYARTCALYIFGGLVLTSILGNVILLFFLTWLENRWVIYIYLNYLKTFTLLFKLLRYLQIFI